jgi:uncharacterized protein
MKFLLLLLVLVIAGWLLFGRRRKGGDESRTSGKPRGPTKGSAKDRQAPQEMVSCSHCGLHLPESDALTDAQGRPFCSDAHRLAGPR